MDLWRCFQDLLLLPEEHSGTVLHLRGHAGTWYLVLLFHYSVKSLKKLSHFSNHALYFQVTVDLCILAQVWIYRSLDLELSDLTLFLVNRENTEKRKRSERLAL